MKKSTYAEKIAFFLSSPFFTSAEAEKKGIPRYVLSYLVKKGTLERLHRGAYRFIQYEPKVDFQWENLALIAASIPNGVICLISALCYYDLTDEIMREVWIAIPHSSRPPKRPNTKIVRMRNIELGKIEISLGEYKVYIFDRERCIIDAFRYLSKEVALKSLKKYLQDREYKPQIKKLAKYAKALRVNITSYILSYTT